MNLPRRSAIRLLFLTLFLPALLSCSDEEEIRILFAGDILLSRMVREEYHVRGSSPFERMQALFRQSDWVVGNLEGVVGEAEHPDGHDLIFDVREADLRLLREAGFHALTVENNHCLDLGAQGKANTIQALKRYGLAAIHAGNSPQFFTVRGTVIALIAVNTVGKTSAVARIPSVEMMQQLRLAKNLSQLVIVSVHWGSELWNMPDPEQRRIAQWLVAHGADVIIGSHPHVIQPPETVNGKPVFFSLGNHLFDQKYPATKEGMIADIRIKNGKVRCTGILTRTLQGSFYPAPTGETDFGFRATKLKEPFLYNSMTLRPIEENDSAGTKIRLRAYRREKTLWTSSPIALTHIETARLDGKKEYLFALERHFSDMDGETSLRPYVYEADGKGIRACWRGSAMAYPMIDAHISPLDRRTLCVLHRGDSFILPDPKTGKKRSMIYRWNGFGFSASNDTTIAGMCRTFYFPLLSSTL